MNNEQENLLQFIRGMARSASPSSFYHEACPELGVALSPFGYAQGKLRRRGSRRVEGVVEGERSCFEFSFLEIHNCHT